MHQPFQGVGCLKSLEIVLAPEKSLIAMPPARRSCKSVSAKRAGAGCCNAPLKCTAMVSDRVYEVTTPAVKDT